MSDLIKHQPPHLPARPPGGGVPARRDEEPIYYEEEDAFDFRRYLQILLRHKWLILAFLVTGGVLAQLETSMTTPLYRSSTTILIDPPSNILPYEEIQAITERLQWDTTQLKILESRSLARRVVGRLDLGNNPRFGAPIQTGFINKIPGVFGFMKQAALSWLPSGETRPADAPSEQDKTRIAAGRLLGNLNVQAERTTRIIRADFSSHDPELAALVVNTLADDYIELNFESKFEATTKATDFLEKQLLELKIQIEKAEENLVLYTRESEYIDFSNENDITLQKLSSLTEELTRVETELISRRASYESVKEDSNELARSPDLDYITQVLEFHLVSHVADVSPTRVFIHSGAVGWQGQAILVPGESMSGKSALVSELVRAGAEYYSDEFALLDPEGRLHPYPKPLSLREGDSLQQTDYPIEVFGGRVGRIPLPVGMVLFATYQEGARFRPRPLSRGQGTLQLLPHTAGKSTDAARVLDTLQHLGPEVRFLEGARGEAAEVAPLVLSRL